MNNDWLVNVGSPSEPGHLLKARLSVQDANYY